MREMKMEIHNKKKRVAVTSAGVLQTIIDPKAIT